MFLLETPSLWLLSHYFLHIFAHGVPFFAEKSGSIAQQIVPAMCLRVPTDLKSSTPGMLRLCRYRPCSRWEGCSGIFQLWSRAHRMGELESSRRGSGVGWRQGNLAVSVDIGSSSFKECETVGGCFKLVHSEVQMRHALRRTRSWSTVCGHKQ